MGQLIIGLTNTQIIGIEVSKHQNVYKIKLNGWCPSSYPLVPYSHLHQLGVDR